MAAHWETLKPTLDAAFAALQQRVPGLHAEVITSAYVLGFVSNKLMGEGVSGMLTAARRGRAILTRWMATGRLNGNWTKKGGWVLRTDTSKDDRAQMLYASVLSA